MRTRIFWVAAIVAAIVVAAAALGEDEDGGDASESALVQDVEESTTEPGVSDPPPAPSPPPPPLTLARVIDGDTIALDNGDRVRLVQIDAPERSGECYGKKAGAVLRQLLPVGTEVRLEADRRLDKADRYGRLLRYVFVGRRNVNLMLVQRGAASVWYFQGDKGRYAARLLAAAEGAQAAGRGAWGACVATLDPTRGFEPRHQPPPAPPPSPPPSSSNCHPSYEGACLDPNAYDYDCEGGSGDGPEYTGAVRVVGPDDYELDRDGDGFACE